MDGETSGDMQGERPAAHDGDAGALPLTDALYKELRVQAERHLLRRFGRTGAGLTWQPTVLLNEAILRLIRRPRRYDSQGHFLALANTAMKHVLVDYARRRASQKRGNGRNRLKFDPDLHSPLSIPGEGLYDVEEVLAALDRLTASLQRKGQVAWMRLVWGLTIREIADALEVSRSSVDRDWRFAQAWLLRELENSPDNRNAGVAAAGETPARRATPPPPAERRS